MRIEPKKLYNPVMASKAHVRLHKELKFTHARYVHNNFGPSQHISLGTITDMCDSPHWHGNSK